MERRSNPQCITRATESVFHVLIAQFEAEAMGLLREGSIDVAILDANLLSGVEIAKIKHVQASIGDPTIEDKTYTFVTENIDRF